MSGGKVMPSDPKYSIVKAPFSLIFDKLAEIVKIQDDKSLPKEQSDQDKLNKLRT